MRVGVIDPKDNDGVLVIVFLDEETGERFEIQGPVLGESEYCLVVNSGPNVRGGIRSFSRVGSKFSFWLTPEAVETLGVPEDFFFVADELQESQLQSVCSAINRAIGNQ